LVLTKQTVDKLGVLQTDFVGSIGNKILAVVYISV